MSVDINKCTIEKLNNSNYQTWRYNVEIYLLSKDVIKYVENDLEIPIDDSLRKTFLREQATCLSIIAQTIDNQNLSHIIKTKNPYQAWKTLEQQHTENTLQNLIYYQNELANIKINPSTVVADIIKFKNIIHHLRILGEEFSEKYVIAQLLPKLPEEYRSFVQAVQHGGKDYNLDEIISRIKNESRYLNKNKNYNINNTYNSKSCQICKKTNHTTEKCFKNKNNYKKKKRYCTICRMNNHDTEYCYKNKNNQNKNNNINSNNYNQENQHCLYLQSELKSTNQKCS